MERFNRTLLGMLGTLEEKDKSRWKEFVKPLVHAYNCTKHESTGFSPYELMFGRQPRLPLDLAFGLPREGISQTSHSQYVQHLKSHLKESYEVATRNALKLAERNKVRFDKRVTESALEVGDRVLVRNVRIRGKHKLADKWESEVYVVTKRADNLPVYTIRPETKDGPVRTLHRDLLLPCGFLPVPETVDSIVPKPVSKSRTRSSLGEQEQEEFTVNSEMNDETSDSVFRNCPFKERRFITFHDFPRQRDILPVVNPGSSLPVGDTEEIQSTEMVEEHLPVEVSAENSPDVAASAESTHTPETENVNGGDNVGEESGENTCNTCSEGNTVAETECRRSTRERTKPRILTYPSLGNPLIQVAQSLFQGLNTAFVTALSGIANPSEFIETSQT